MPELRSKIEKLCAPGGKEREERTPRLFFLFRARRNEPRTRTPRSCGKPTYLAASVRREKLPSRVDALPRPCASIDPNGSGRRRYHPSISSASNPKETLEASSPPRERIDPSVGFQRAFLRSVCRKGNTRRPRSGRSVPSSVRLFEPTPPWLLILSKRENNKRKENEEEG